MGCECAYEGCYASDRKLRFAFQNSDVSIFQSSVFRVQRSELRVEECCYCTIQISDSGFCFWNSCFAFAAVIQISEISADMFIIPVCVCVCVQGSVFGAPGT